MKTTALLRNIIGAFVLLFICSQLSAQCNVVLQSGAVISPPRCSLYDSVGVVSGGYFDLSLNPSTYYDYSFLKNGCSAATGMCISPNNGSGSTGSLGNVTGFNNWFAGTCTSVRLSTFNSGTIGSCSAVLLYRYSTPSTPVFSASPTSVCSGVATTYSVSAAVAATSYTWTVTGSAGGSIVSGQGSSSVSITFARAGTAVVQVTASNGGVCNSGTASSATINVAGISINSSQTICTGTATTLMATASGGTGTPSYQWQSSPNGSTWTNAGTNSSSVSTGNLSATTFYRCIYTNTGMACSNITSNVDTITIVPQISITQAPVGTTLCPGVNSALIISATGGGTLSYQWQYLNGSTFVNVSNGLPTGINYTGANATTLNLTTSSSTPTGTYSYRCVISSSAGCPQAITTIAAFNIVPQPFFNSQTNADTACLGSSKSVFVSASGGVSLSYQWQYLNGGTYVNVSNGLPAGVSYTNATTSTLTIASTTGVTTPSTYTYRCVVNSQNACNTIISNPIAFTVAGVTIASSQGICSGSSATLTATANARPSTSSYQWQSSPNQSTWTNVGTNSTTFSTGALSSTTYYRCLYTNAGLSCSGIPSNVDTITLLSQLQIGTQPTSQSICAGGAASFSVSATGAGVLSYQWQFFNGSTFVNVTNGTPAGVTYTNANTSTLAVAGTNGVTPLGNYQYRCVVSTNTGCASVNSSTVILTVVAPPGISSQTSFDTICNGTSGSISVTATGGFTLSYQWQYFNGVSFVNVVNGTPVGVSYSNQTTPTLTIATTNGTTIQGNYRYQCMVSSSGGCSPVSSSGTTVTVGPPTPVAPAASSATNVTCNSFTAQWSPAANATTYYVDVAYDQTFADFLPGWDERNVGNVTSVNITGLNAWLPYYYRVRAGNNCTGSASSTITVFTLPAAPAIPSDVSTYNFEYVTVPGDNQQLAFTIYGSGNPSFLQDFSVVSGTPNIYFSGNISGVNAYAGNQYVLSGVCGIAGGWSEGLQLNHNFKAGGSYNVSLGIRNIPGTPSSSPTPIDIQFVLLQAPLTSTFIPGDGCSPTPSIPSGALVVNTITSFAQNSWQPISFTIPALSTNYSQLWIREQLSSGAPLVTTDFAFDSLVVSQASGNSQVPTNVTCNSFTANWNASVNATAYLLDVSTTPSFSSFVNGWNNINVGNVLSANITGLTSGATYYYRVRATDNCGTSNSTFPISVTIGIPPVITTEPSASVSVCRGGIASVGLVAGGTPPLTYQWQYNNAGTWAGVTNNVPTGISYTGSTTAVLNYTTSFAASPQVNQYRCVVGGPLSCGFDTSRVTSLVVNSAAKISACPGSVTLNTDPSQCDAIVNYAAATAIGSPTPTITYSRNSGTIFPLGTTVVTVIASNICGSDTCSFTVTVVDHTPPSITCPGNQVLALNENCSATFPDYTHLAVTSDNCSSAGAGAGSIVVTQYPPVGQVINGLNNYPVTLTATDAAGNSNSCNFNVSVIDTTPPVAICRNKDVYLDSSGHASVTVADINNDSYDNCTITSITISISSFDCSNVGTNPVILTVTDISGNVSTCSATVNVIDNSPPVVICKNISVQLDGSGSALITPVQVDNGSYDNCGIASYSIYPYTFNCSTVGNNAVQLTVTDVNGNSASCNATVTVQDNTAPVAICHDLTISLDATGAASITAQQVNNGSYDNCGIASISVTPSSFTCADVGLNPITFTVTDSSGNISICHSTVTVVDNISPNAICKDVTVQLDASGNVSITANEVNNGSYDNCGISTFSVSPNAFTCTNVGANAVTLSVTDLSGNVSTCSSTVTVQDNIAPTAVCQNVTVQLDASGNASVTAAQVNNGSFDNCAIASVSVSPNTFTCENLGANTVTLTVTDVNGNTSTCNSTVTIQDNIEPTAICQDVTVQLDANGNASVTAAQVNNGSYDNCGVASVSVSPNTFTCENLGANTVTLTVTDLSGNVSTCNAMVIVQDNTAPTASCKDLTVQLDANGTTSITAAQVNNGSYDNCSIASVVVQPDMFTCENVGNNTVTLIVTDGSGNISTCYSTVIVQDNIAPTAICRNVTLQLDATGNASVTAAQVDNGSHDNCGIASMAVSPATFTCNNVGANTVTLTVTDVNGNVSNCNSTVTVQDNITPTAVCQNVTVQLDASGNASVTAAQVNNGSYDNCGIASMSVSPNTFTCSNVGANTVTLTVTDVNGNVSTCTATVTVQDNINPIASCKNITVQLNAGGSASITAAQVNNGSTDNCGIASVSVFPNTFTCANVGNNTVTLTVTDVNGNSSTCTSIVTVQDNTVPTAICKPATIYLNNSGSASVTATQVDNGSSDVCGIASRSVSPSSFTCSNVGSNTVTLTVNDVNGNSSSCSTTVTVVDTVKPIAICKNITVTLGSNGTTSITASQVNNGSSDNCGIASMTVSPSSFNCSNIGNNTVTLTVTDNSNNVSTCSSTVTVSGSLPVCSIAYVPGLDTIGSSNVGSVLNTIFLGYGPQSFKLNSSVSGGSSFSYSWSGTGLSCYTCANPVFAPTAPGNYTFTLTVINNYGCSTTCSIRICVIDARSTHAGKILMCHHPPGNPANTDTIDISGSAVQTHLANGDELGGCGVTCNSSKTDDEETLMEQGNSLIISDGPFNAKIYPNPFTVGFHLKVESPSNEIVSLRIFDVAGKQVEEKKSITLGEEVELGYKLASGLYVVEIKQGERTKQLRILKSE